MVSHEITLGRILGSRVGLDDRRVDICNVVLFLFTTIIVNDIQSIQSDGCGAFSYVARNRLLCLKRDTSTISLQLVDISTSEGEQPLGLEGRVRCAFQLEQQHCDASLDIAEYPSHRPEATFQLRPESRVLSIICRTERRHTGTWGTSTVSLYSPNVMPVSVLLRLAEGREGRSWSWNEWRWFAWNSTHSENLHNGSMTSTRMSIWKEGSRTYPQPIPIHFFEHHPSRVGPLAGSPIYAVPLARRVEYAYVAFREDTKLMRVMSSEDNLVVWEVRLTLIPFSFQRHNHIIAQQRDGGREILNVLSF